MSIDDDLTFDDSETSSSADISSSGQTPVHVSDDGKNISLAVAGSGPAALTLTDGSYWSDYGFANGQYIRIIGSGSNNDGLYRIDSVNFDVIELDAAYDFSADETLVSSQSANVLGLATRADEQAIILNAGTELTFDETTNTITRHDGGDWWDDGFRENYHIVVQGSTGGFNDGIYLIESASGDTLTLDGATPLTQDDLNITDARVFASQVRPVNTILALDSR